MYRNRQLPFFVSTNLALLLLMVSVGRAELPDADPGDRLMPPRGVTVNADGLMLDRPVPVTTHQPSSTDLSPEERFCYISLPRIFAKAREEMEAGRPLDDTVRYLDGMVQVEYLFVFPDKKDIVLAGPREPVDKSDPFRPVGTITGRPVLHLDDLVVAFRSVGPGTQQKYFGCSLDFSELAALQIAGAARKRGEITEADFPSVEEQFKEIMGHQEVRFFNLPKDTRFAFVTIEADYLLKRLALKHQQTGIPELTRRVHDLAPGDDIYNRWWFAPLYQSFLVDQDGSSFRIRGQALKVRSSNSIDSNSENLATNENTRHFGQLVTEHLPQLSQKFPCIADLWNLSDLGLIASLIAHDKLDQRCGWDIDWLQKKYRLHRVTTPKYAETLVSVTIRDKANAVNVAIGGVELTYEDQVLPEARTVDQNAELRDVRLAPSNGFSQRAPLPKSNQTPPPAEKN